MCWRSARMCRRPLTCVLDVIPGPGPAASVTTQITASSYSSLTQTGVSFSASAQVAVLSVRPTPQAGAKAAQAVGPGGRGTILLLHGRAQLTHVSRLQVSVGVNYESVETSAVRENSQVRSPCCREQPPTAPLTAWSPCALPEPAAMLLMWQLGAPAPASCRYADLWPGAYPLLGQPHLLQPLQGPARQRQRHLHRLRGGGLGVRRRRRQARP